MVDRHVARDYSLSLRHVGAVGTCNVCLLVGLTLSPPTEDSVCIRTVCTKTQSASGHSLHQDTVCTKTQPASGHSLHQDTTCTRIQPAPEHSLHQDTACTRTRPAPGHSLHQDTVCINPTAGRHLQHGTVLVNGGNVDILFVVKHDLYISLKLRGNKAASIIFSKQNHLSRFYSTYLT